MKGVVILLLLGISSIFGKTIGIDFIEDKYINALNIKVSKEGHIDFKDDTITLKYKKSEKSVTFTKENILITQNNKETKYTHNEQKPYTLYFTMIDAVYKNDLTKLEAYFSVSQKNDTVTLSPIGEIGSIMNKIEYNKKNNKLFMQIYFTNEDIITIHEIK